MWRIISGVVNNKLFEYINICLKKREIEKYIYANLQKLEFESYKQPLHNKM